MLGGLAALVVGVFACSTAVILIKLSAVDSVWLAAYRQLLAAGLLMPLLCRDLRRSAEPAPSRALRRCLAPGALLGLHFITWIIGARLTPAANSSLIVNMTPVAMPFFLLAWSHERLNRGELLGTALALAGVLVLAGADFRISAASFRGDALCFLSMLLFTAYLALARTARGALSLWAYVTPVYAVGGALSLGLALLWRRPPVLIGRRDALLVLGLAVIPTIVGHSILNAAMRWLRGQVVAIANLSQFMFAGVLAYLLLGERPHAGFLPASLLVVAGAILAIRSSEGVDRSAASA